MLNVHEVPDGCGSPGRTYHKRQKSAESTWRFKFVQLPIFNSVTLYELSWLVTHLVQQAKTNTNNANTIWPTPVRRTVRRHRVVLLLFLFVFYMENTVQVPSGLPRLKAHGVHWATDVSILEMKRKEKAEKHMSGLSSHLKLRQTPFEAQQIIFLGGSGAAAYRLSLAFRIPLGVISAPTDPRGRLSTENTNKNGLRVISL